MVPPESDLAWNGTVLIAGHLAMVALFKIMLADYPRDAYVLESTSLVLWFALFSAPPVFVGLAAKRPQTAVLIALGHALSPLSLLEILRTPGQDLNFMYFVWWFYVPAFVIAVLGVEYWLINRRR